MRITGCDLHALSGLLSSIVATVARPHPQEKDHQLPPWQALGAMRTINTLQGAAFQQPRHQYLSLDEISSSSCGLAVFSNEYGIIYTARGMGCPQEKPL